MRRENVLSVLILLLLIVSIVAIFLKPPVPFLRKSTVTFTPREKGELAILYIYGPIEVREPGVFPFMLRGSDYLVSRLRELGEIKGLKAVVLRINSPGGSVAAVQDIYQELSRLKEKGIKIVSSLGEIATSGAYYIASVSDLIVAEPGTITGSIGVIIPLVNMKNLLEKLGVEFYSVKSGKYKDIGTVSRRLSLEEEKILRSLVDTSYRQFLEAVKQGRGERFKGDWEEVADGRIFSGETAKELGLVDYLGNLERAKELACKIAGIKGKPEVIGERRGWESIFLRLEESITAPLRILSRREPIPEYRYYPENIFSQP